MAEEIMGRKREFCDTPCSRREYGQDNPVLPEIEQTHFIEDLQRLVVYRNEPREFLAKLKYFSDTYIYPLCRVASMLYLSEPGNFGTAQCFNHEGIKFSVGLADWDVDNKQSLTHLVFSLGKDHMMHIPWCTDKDYRPWDYLDVSAKALDLAQQIPAAERQKILDSMIHKLPEAEKDVRIIRTNKESRGYPCFDDAMLFPIFDLKTGKPRAIAIFGYHNVGIYCSTPKDLINSFFMAKSLNIF